MHEQREKVGIVGRSELAARAQLGLDLRQHMPIGQEAVDSYVCVVDAGCDVGDQAHHQRPPDSRIGKKLARGQSHRVEQVGRRERIVDLARTRLAQQDGNAQIESVCLTPGHSEQMEGALGQRRLLLLIECVQNAQRRERCVMVDAATLATPAGQALFEEIVERLVEALHPFDAHVAKGHRSVVFDELVRFEQVVGRLDRHHHQIVKLRLDQREAIPQQRIGGRRAEEQLAVLVGRGRNGVGCGRVGHRRSACR